MVSANVSGTCVYPCGAPSCPYRLCFSLAEAKYQQEWYGPGNQVDNVIKLVGEPKSGTTLLTLTMVSLAKNGCGGGYGSCMFSPLAESHDTSFTVTSRRLRTAWTANGKHNMPLAPRTCNVPSVPKRMRICIPSTDIDLRRPLPFEKWTAIPLFQVSPKDRFVLILRDPREVVVSEFYYVNANRGKKWLNKYSVGASVVVYAQKHIAAKVGWARNRFLLHFSRLRNVTTFVQYHDLVECPNSAYLPLCKALGIACTVHTVEKTRKCTSKQAMQDDTTLVNTGSETPADIVSRIRPSLSQLIPASVRFMMDVEMARLPPAFFTAGAVC